MVTEKIIELVKKTFPNSTVEITLQTTPNDVDEWDSLGHIMLIQAIEEAFDISFDLDELLGFESVESIVNVVGK